MKTLAFLLCCFVLAVAQYDDEFPPLVPRNYPFTHYYPAQATYYYNPAVSSYYSSSYYYPKTPYKYVAPPVVAPVAYYPLK